MTKTATLVGFFQYKHLHSLYTSRNIQVNATAANYYRILSHSELEYCHTPVQDIVTLWPRILLHSGRGFCHNCVQGISTNGKLLHLGQGYCHTCFQDINTNIPRILSHLGPGYCHPWATDIVKIRSRILSLGSKILSHLVLYC